MPLIAVMVLLVVLLGGGVVMVIKWLRPNPYTPDTLAGYVKVTQGDAESAARYFEAQHAASRKIPRDRVGVGFYRLPEDALDGGLDTYRLTVADIIVKDDQPAVTASLSQTGVVVVSPPEEYPTDVDGALMVCGTRERDKVLTTICSWVERRRHLLVQLHGVHIDEGAETFQRIVTEYRENR